MRWHGIIAVFSAAIVGGVAADPPCHAQAIQMDKQPPLIAVSIAMEKGRIIIGQKPWTTLTMDNIGSHVVRETAQSYRVHVDGPNGGPAKTIWYRRLMGEPGLPAIEVTLGPLSRDIFPYPYAGHSIDWKFDLSAFYDLNAPGKYSVSLDVRDDVSGTWLTTNRVAFEIEAPAH